jgi:hypothetical protein
MLNVKFKAPGAIEKMLKLKIKPPLVMYLA